MEFLKKVKYLYLQPVSERKENFSGDVETIEFDKKYVKRVTVNFFLIP